MKKQLLIFAALAAFSASFAADLIAPVRTMVIPYAKVGTMQIDGIDDEAWWSAEQSTDAFNKTGSTGADQDFTLSFKVCYDDSFLYVFGKILDDYDNSWEWGGSNQWEFDNVEIFVNLDTNGTVAAYDSNTYQLRWNRGLDSVGNDFGRTGAILRSQHKYYWENTADGWLFESALNWKFVLGAGQKLEDILAYLDPAVVHGFDVSGGDSDTDGAGARDCQTAWDNDDPDTDTDRTEDNAWNNRLVLGIVTFAPMTDVDVVSSSNSAVAYPNPTTGIVNFNGVTGTIEIANLAGQVVMTTEVVNNQINIANLPAGVYVAKAGNDNVRIIKQ